MDIKVDILRRIPNLRTLSMSAWIDAERIRTRKYSVSVESGEGLAAEDIPSAAETYDVSIDQQYVVIDIP